MRRVQILLNCKVTAALGGNEPGTFLTNTLRSCGTYIKDTGVTQVLCEDLLSTAEYSFNGDDWISGG